MCGFNGFVVTTTTRDNAAVIREMSDQIVHRGPDDDGYFVNDRIALGFRRLSIIDLEGGHQPMTRAQQDYTVVFNGEIYNYQELRVELEAKGYVFATHSDTETLLHGFVEWGDDLPRHLRGMFAFVIFDHLTGELFGARDIFGIKPFYYYKEGSTFLFGSEIKSFLKHPDFVKSFNTELLPAYLSFEYIPDHRTFFDNVYKLLPGHSFRYKDGDLTIRRYHEIDFHIDPSITLDQATTRIREQFVESVQAHMIADVEVGSFLSSGVDSSYVAYQANLLTPLRTYSVGYENSQWSELPYSTAFAEKTGIQNTAATMGPEDFFGAAADIQWFMDEPLSNPSAVPLYFVAKEASKDVKVVLSGEGADELFGGYNHYNEPGSMRAYLKLPFFLRSGLSKFASKFPKIKGRRFLVRGGQPLYQRYFRIDYVFNEAERSQLLRDPSLNFDTATLSKSLFDHVSNLDDVTQMQYVDMYTWLIYDILLKADRMSMANSLELRVPFLDKKMLELAMTLPEKTRVVPKQGKIALRKAAASVLPPQVSNRPKIGFPSPLFEWMRQPEYSARISAVFDSATARHFFNNDFLRKMLADHVSGKVSNMQKIWSIYCFVLWFDQYFPEGVDSAQKAA